MNNDQYPDLVAREQKLQADVLKLSEENLSLRFEVTQLQQEVPRLKVKPPDETNSFITGGNYVFVLFMQNLFYLETCCVWYF